MRRFSKISADWWDYTTIDDEILDAAAKLSATDLVNLSRKGFAIKIYDTLQEFFAAEALEYIWCWKQATAKRPAGICGPIGPTEQLPIVAQMVNALGLSLKHCHFWGMDEWYENGKAVGTGHPLGFANADLTFCFDRIDKKLRMPKENLHFPSEKPEKYTDSYDQAKCLIMQGGQGEIKHWAFNEPLRRIGKYAEKPPTKEEYLALKTRIVELHPMTIIQNARTSGGGIVSNIPSKAISVGPYETWKCEKVSIWHPGWHDNAFGIRLSAFMISNRIADPCVPISLLADHPSVQFNYYRGGIGTCDVEMH